MAGTKSTADRVRELISRHLYVDLDKVTDGAVLKADLGADSLDDVEIVMAIEDEFGIEIGDDEVYMVLTVCDLVTLVRGKVK